MKKLMFSFLLLCALNLNAQWSNTNNLFKDSLHMDVSNATRTQSYPIVIQSYPDGGYIYFWEDSRDYNTNGTDIYAQKFDKNGNRLWALDGVPVASNNYNQHFYNSTNADYRNYSYAATDSSGGFYIAYLDDSVSNYYWYRVCVQHIKANGTKVFGNTGFIVAQTPSGEYYNYGSQQLIADGNNGFYVGYIRNNGYSTDVYVKCFKDIGGSLKYYGGGQMDVNAYERVIDGCGNIIVDYRDAYVTDYMIYTDLQKGCNVNMNMSQNAGGNDRYFTGYNRLVRVKKKSTVVTNNTFLNTQVYNKDSVIIFYRIGYRTYQFQCDNGIGEGQILDGNGYLQTSNLTYQIQYVKGNVMQTNGNINVDVMTYNDRKIITNQLTAWYTHVFTRRNEITDSIPYEFTVYPWYPQSYVSTAAPYLNKLNNYHDTLIASGNTYYYDFNTATAGNNFYATALTPTPGSDRFIYLQNFQLKKITPDSFAFVLNTASKSGLQIGKEQYTGFGGTTIQYEFPRIATDDFGNALFYVNEVGRSVRVSPIINGSQLAWGAMGRHIGGGTFGGYYYNSITPFAVTGYKNGVGAITWQDNRYRTGSTAENIYTRHLDSLNKANYYPPYLPVKILPYYGGTANPTILLGSSKRFSLINIYNAFTSSFGPIAEILDNNNMGSLLINVNQNTGAVRSYNGIPYMDRNYNFYPQTGLPNAINVTMRLFFTTQEFNALKAANPAISNPGKLFVMKQPAANSTPPSAYSPAAGEVMYPVQSWKAVDGGYFVQITVNKFSGYFNFYIGGKTAAPPGIISMNKGDENNSIVKNH